MKWFNNIKFGVKVLGGFGIGIILLIVVSVESYLNLTSISVNTSQLYLDHNVPMIQLGNAQASLNSFRGNVYKYILFPAKREAIGKTVQSDLANVDQSIKSFRTASLSTLEIDELKNFDTAFSEYKAGCTELLKMVDDGDNSGALKTIDDGGRVAVARAPLLASMAKLIDINKTNAEALDKESKAKSNNAIRLIIVLSIAAVLASLGLGILITSNLNKPLSIMTLALKNLSKGNLNRDISQKDTDIITKRDDELGETGKALAQTTMYLTSMSAMASQIASGDLTVQVVPNSEKDELAVAFKGMVESLHKQVVSVSESAISLTAASQQLAVAAEQAGQATTQISTTVQQVAMGITSQSESVSRTASSAEQSARAIEGVAKGAQEQALAVGRASTITSQISSAVEGVAGNAEAVTTESARTADAARKGEKTVEQTIQGMQAIKAKVGISAEKVGEMGQRSEQIGTIVEAIEDIASQTNLLALNAAIEAARAGEHGKGFAVVADEVRKLAERASSATREIGELIGGIQRTVKEAVEAMQAGSTEVENGVARANQAGTALGEILEAAQAVHKQAEQAALAAGRISAFTTELVGAVDTVSAVVEENTAATEQMSAGSMEVNAAIENIASVSEQNSAAIEQVSASAEEMSAQVEEVTASAQSLSEMAKALQDVVSQFKLSEG